MIVFYHLRCDVEYPMQYNRTQFHFFRLAAGCFRRAPYFVAVCLLVFLLPIFFQFFFLPAPDHGLEEAT